MPNWANRVGNELFQLEAALVHALHANADLLRLPGGRSNLAVHGILDVPSVIRLSADSAAAPAAEAGAAGCVPCDCCGDFTDLKYRCRTASPDQRQAVSLRYLRPLLQPCTEILPEVLPCEAPVVLHMRSGDIMLDSVESGWYPQPPCSYYAEVFERGLEGKPFGCAVVLTEADRRNPCVDFAEQRLGASVRSSSVREDACIMTSSPNLALSFGSWGPSLARLSGSLLRLFVPFGEEGGAEYSGILAKNTEGKAPAKHFDGWAASWSAASVLQRAARYHQTLYSFPGYRTHWTGWADRVRQMLEFPQSTIVVSKIPVPWEAENASGALADEANEEGKVEEAATAVADPAAAGTQQPGQRAHEPAAEEATLRDGASILPAAAGPPHSLACVRREAADGLQVCAAWQDSGLRLLFYAGGVLILSLLGLEASGRLLSLARPRVVPEAEQLECSAVDLSLHDGPVEHGRLVKRKASGAYCIFARVEAGGLIHVGVRGAWAAGTKLHALLLHFAFHGSGRDLYRHLPNLHHRDGALASDHFFRSPMAVIVSQGCGAALLPDLDVLHRTRLLPHALDLRSRPLRLMYGMVASKLEPHMYAAATGESIAPPENLAAKTELFALQFLMQAPGDPAALVARATSYMWDRYGRRHLYGDVRPQILPFEQYGFRYAYAGHLAHLAVRIGEDLWGIDNPGRGGVNYDAWENDAMVALGLQHYAEKAGNEALLRVAAGMWRLGLSAPVDRGAFPAVYDPRTQAWQPMVKILGHHSGAFQCSSEEYFSVPAMAVTMWHYLYLLELSPETPHREAILQRLEGLTGLLLAIQLPSGAVPHWIHTRSFQPCHQLRESAATAIAGAVLAKAAALLPARAGALRAGALAAGRFVAERVLPEQRFHDFEAFFSCSPKDPDWRDGIAGILPQSTLSMQWAADLFLALHRLTAEGRWLPLGEYVLSTLSLYQQVWSPPYFREEAYMFGGFGVMNTDAEWSDGRVHRFLFTYVDYYMQTGTWESLERAVAAARAGFTNMHIPENQQFGVSQANGPLEPENLEHFHEHDKGQWTGFTWGSGGALAASAYLERRLGGVWLDAARGRALGLDGAAADVLPAPDGAVRLRLRSQLPKAAFGQPRSLLLRSGGGGPVELEVNGERLGRRQLGDGTPVALPPGGPGPGPRLEGGEPVLLGDDEMQAYIAHGYLLLRPQLPDSVHERIIAKTEMLRREVPEGETPQEGNNILPYVPELLEVYESPEVVGALTSVLGRDYAMHAHRHAHLNEHVEKAQATHQDSFFGLQAFRPHQLQWAMAMYFPQDTTLEMGPTAVVPGSQYASLELRFRYNGEGDVANTSLAATVGSLHPLCVPRGSVLLMHYDLYHAASQRFSHLRPRWMYKFQFYRLRPPGAPSWAHHSPDWRPPQPPGASATCSGRARPAPPGPELARYRSPIWRSVWAWLLGRPPPGAGTAVEEAGAPGAGAAAEGEPRSLEEWSAVLLEPNASEARLQWAAYGLAAEADSHRELVAAMLLAQGLAARRAAMHGAIAASRHGVDVGGLLVDVMLGRWREREWMISTLGRCCAQGLEHEVVYSAAAVLGHLGPEAPSREAALQVLVAALRAAGPHNAAAGGEAIVQERAQCMQEFNEYRLCEGGPPPLRAVAAEGLGRLGTASPRRAAGALARVLTDYAARAPNMRTLADFDDARAVMAAARAVASLAAQGSLGHDLAREEGLAEALAQAAHVLSSQERTSELRGQPKDLRRYALAEVLQALSWVGGPAERTAALQLAQRGRLAAPRSPDARQLPASVPDGASLRRHLQMRVCDHTAVGTPW